VLSGGTLQLNPGGVVVAADVSSGGTLWGSGTLIGGVAVAGTVGAAAVAGGGAVFVESHGGTFGLTVEKEGWIDVGSGGLASGTDVLASGQLTLDSGGVASGTTIRSGAFEYDMGLERSGTIAAGGAIEVIGSADSLLINGAETLDYRAVASRNMIGSGGSVTANGGAKTVSDTILSGGLEITQGEVDGAVVSNGGTLRIVDGTASGVTVKSGGLLIWDGFLGSSLTDGPQMSNALSFSGATLSSGARLQLDVAIAPGVTLSLAAGAPVAEAFVSQGGSLIGPGVVSDVNDAGLFKGAAIISGGTRSG
jgi:autotransporter passenger strand-loop-strand repeat protein